MRKTKGTRKKKNYHKIMLINIYLYELFREKIKYGFQKINKEISSLTVRHLCIVRKCTYVFKKNFGHLRWLQRSEPGLSGIFAPEKFVPYKSTSST